MDGKEKRYVKVPWKTFMPLFVFLVLMIVLVFIDTGIVVFSMPLETFLVCWLSYAYILIAAFVHILGNSKGGKNNE